jgi:hypothetical protein
MANTGQTLAENLRNTIRGLDATKFESLAPGLGLGVLRPKDQQSVYMPQPVQQIPPPPAMAQNSFSTHIVAEKPEPRAGTKKLGMSTKLLAHVVDMIIVIVTGMVGLIVVEFLTRGGIVPWREMSWLIYLQDTGWIKAVIMVYFLYVLYWLLFKIFAGITLGENFFVNSSSK